MLNYLKLGSDILRDVVADLTAYDMQKILDTTETVQPSLFVLKEGKQLADRVSNAKEDADILDITRTWLKSNGYGKRQFEVEVYERTRKLYPIPMSQ